MPRADSGPTLAVVYHPMSASPMNLRQAARGLCRLLFVVDLSDPVLGPLAPLFYRLGVVVDTTGLDSESIARQMAEYAPAGIMTLAEEQLLLTARLAALLHLPFFDPETAANLHDKFHQRLALSAAGVPGPLFWAARHDMTAEELNEFAGDVDYPAVLKPRRGTGSRQTLLLNGRVDLVRALEGSPEPGGFLVEQYLPGVAEDGHGGRSDCVAVESIVQGGEIAHLALTGRFHMAAPFRGAGSFLPSDLDAELTDAVFTATETAVKALGIQHGALNTDLKLTPDGPVVVEVNGRVGGNVPELFELAGGPPLMTAAMRLALSLQTEFDSPVEFARLAYYLWEQPPTTAHRLLQVRGLDEVRALPGVDSVTLNRRPGDQVDWREGSWGHIFAVWGVAATAAELDAVRRHVARLVAVEYE